MTYDNPDPVEYTEVTVTHRDLSTVVDHGTVLAVTGTAGPERITFAGDHRAVRTLLAAVAESGEPQTAQVADYQIRAAWVPEFEHDELEV